MGRKRTVRSQVKIARNAHSLEPLLPADLKGTARVRAFFEVVGEGLARERKLFEGRRMMENEKNRPPPAGGTSATGAPAGLNLRLWTDATHLAEKSLQTRLGNQ
jgi:hypothetical protein